MPNAGPAPFIYYAYAGPAPFTMPNAGPAPFTMPNAGPAPFTVIQSFISLN